MSASTRVAITTADRHASSRFDLVALAAMSDLGQRARAAQELLSAVRDDERALTCVRDEAICDLVSTGASYGAVAKITGLTRGRVAQITRSTRELGGSGDEAAIVLPPGPRPRA